MYDPTSILAAIDANKTPILTLCTGAMVCNYIWFFAAVWQGFKDKAYPVPILSTLFWLVGDGSVVVRWLTGNMAFNHWYLRQFSMSLILTVICELTFLFMILKFGRKELMPNRSQGQFTAVVLAGLAVMIVTWTYVWSNLADPLNIVYFYLANMAGPALGAALVVKRGTRAGTSPLIWGAYAAMLSFFYAACYLYYGAPFNSLGYVAFYLVNIGISVALMLVVSRMPKVSAAEPAFAPPPRGGRLA
jgi:hypothetical protein